MSRFIALENSWVVGRVGKTRGVSEMYVLCLWCLCAFTYTCLCVCTSSCENKRALVFIYLFHVQLFQLLTRTYFVISRSSNLNSFSLILSRNTSLFYEYNGCYMHVSVTQKKRLRKREEWEKERAKEDEREKKEREKEKGMRRFSIFETHSLYIALKMNLVFFNPTIYFTKDLNKLKHHNKHKTETS